MKKRHVVVVLSSLDDIIPMMYVSTRTTPTLASTGKYQD